MAVILFTPLLYWRYKAWQKKKRLKVLLSAPIPTAWEMVLNQKVGFFKTLTETEKDSFRKKMAQFIYTTKIGGGGGVEVTQELLVLTAASAVIPVFRLPGWPYQSLNDIVLVPHRVRHPGDVKSEEATSITGMVFSRSSSHTVFLSAPALIAGFNNSMDSSNVGIHEFAHLIDNADGIIDGIPAAFIPKKLIIKWMQIVVFETEAIVKGKSDINPYAATNESEFFAVTSEIYFENPKRLKRHHPELYAVLRAVYRGSV